MKRLIATLLIIFIALTVNANDTIIVKKSTVGLNGEFYGGILPWNYPFLNYNDVTYVPITTFSQAFGYDVEVDESTNIYNLTQAVFDGSAKFGEPMLSAHITLEELLTNPQKYIGRRVSVEGYIRVGFEEDELFITYDDYKYYNSSSSVKLNYRTYLPLVLNATLGDLSTVSGRYAKVQGILKQLWEYSETYILTKINLIEVKGEGTRLQVYKDFSKYDFYENIDQLEAAVCDASLCLDGVVYEALNEYGVAVPTFKVDGEMYMPLRAFAKAFDLYIDYDEKDDEIILNRNCNMNLKEYNKDDFTLVGAEYNPVSIVNLFANPQKYENTYISVQGAVKDGKLYQDTTYLSDYIELEKFKGIEEFDNSFVRIIGTLKKQNEKYIIESVDYMEQNRNFEQYPFDLYFDQWYN